MGMTGFEFTIFRCQNCGWQFEYTGDIDRIPSVHIDPATDLPPDVRMVDGLAVTIEMTDEELVAARDGCVRQPICKPCAVLKNQSEANKSRPGPFDLTAYEATLRRY